MTWRGPLVLLLTGVVLSLTPVAHALPPDPTWLPGFWDDADYDDVILTITSSVGVVNVLSVYEARSVLNPVAFMAWGNEGAPLAPALSSYEARAPPA